MEGIMFKVDKFGLERFFENKDQVSFEDIVNKLYEVDDEKELYKEKYEDLKKIKEEDTDRYEDYVLGLM